MPGGGRHWLFSEWELLLAHSLSRAQLTTNSKPQPYEAHSYVSDQLLPCSFLWQAKPTKCRAVHRCYQGHHSSSVSLHALIQNCNCPDGFCLQLWGGGGAARAKPAKRQYAAVAKAISQFEPVTMWADPSVADEAKQYLADAPNVTVQVRDWVWKGGGGDGAGRLTNTAHQ
jgi:hypothetical protein